MNRHFRFVCFVFFQSCTQILIGDLLFNEQNYQPGSLSVLVTDADSSVQIKKKKKRAKALFKVTFNDRKGLKVITKHLKEQVNSPWRKITGDSSRGVLLLIAICYTFWQWKTFSPTYYPPHTKKTGVSAGALKPKLSRCAAVRPIHTVVLKSATRISATLKNTGIYFCSTTLGLRRKMYRSLVGMEQRKGA